MASFNLQLQGYTPANRDAEVTLVNQATGVAINRRPFLDGSLTIPDLDPGEYQVRVTHPNLGLADPIFNRKIRVFPTGPTRVPVPVPAVRFVDNPVKDIVDANLTPVQQALGATLAQVRAIGGKAPGEVIRASDFNTLAQAAADLASAMLELTQLVAPKGHNHPEIEERIDQVQGNLRAFADAYGKSLLEVRREKETDDIDRLVQDLPATIDPAALARIRERVTRLKSQVQAEPSAFTGPLATLGTLVITEMNAAAAAQPDGGEALRNDAAVNELVAKAELYRTSGTQLRAENEIAIYRGSKAATRAFGGRGG